MLNQVELEHQMSSAGRQKLLDNVKKNIAAGRGDENPYSHALYRRYLVPLSALIFESYLGKKGTGKASTPRLLLAGADPDVLAYLTIRCVMQKLLSDAAQEVTLTEVARELGNTVLGEVFLTEFEGLEPGLYFTITRDLSGRHSRSERHRLNVFRAKAAEHGVVIPEWSATDRVTVGSALLYAAKDIGVVSMYLSKDRSGNSRYCMRAGEDVGELTQGIVERLSILSPHQLPFVEPPKDWVGANEGGYHTEVMRRACPTIITQKGFVKDGHVGPLYLKSVNTLQKVKWRINKAVLAVANQVSTTLNVSDLMLQAEDPKPKPPVWLTPDMKAADMNAAQLGEFVGWKRSVANWHTASRKSASLRFRASEILRVARDFRDYPAIYFLYQLDFRGRHYAMSRGVNPQGSDLQKAMLQFAEGSPLDSPSAVKWFKINGANKWGYDKATLEERVKWVEDNHDFIIRCAEHPMSYREWAEADSPFQFLAWALEYREYCTSPQYFLTHLPVAMDGSCNGLQHFSAMMRDEVGGAATNLVPASTQQDIYGRVAAVTRELLETSADKSSPYWARWAAHGVNRTLVKRSVMTLPYGSTRFSCAEFIEKDYMEQGLAPEFSQDERKKAAQYLATLVWEAIGRVVIKAKEIMKWLQEASKLIIKQTDTHPDSIRWMSPAGLVVNQRYPEKEILAVRSRLTGGARLNMHAAKYSEVNLDLHSNRNGIAPNFIHSCDAAHMVYVIDEAERSGMTNLAMIHDDYGVPANRAEEFFHIIRSTFVRMYEEYDPLFEFYKVYYKALEKHTLPTRGSLDLSVVKDSTFFFC